MYALDQYFSSYEKILNKSLFFFNKTSQFAISTMLLDFENSGGEKSFIFIFINDLSAEYVLFPGSTETLCTYFTLNASSYSPSWFKVQVFYRTDIVEKYYHFVRDYSFKQREDISVSLFFFQRNVLFLCPSVCLTLTHFTVVALNHLACHLMLAFISTLDKLQRPFLWKWF